MGGLPINPKYMIYTKIEVEGIVDKSDIIGALFGQTEGLLGSELDLRELQNNGRIGRIEVNVSRTNGKTQGTIKVPSNLNRVETALIAAALEVIDRVGPYPAKVEVVKVEDVRLEKRRQVVQRAKGLLQQLEEEVPESKELIEEVEEALKVAELTYYGPEKLPAGPDVETSDTVIVVEGRADVVNLLKHGYRNVIALGGATIPKSVMKLSGKKTILFIDGDRGGELIARNVLSSINIDYVVRAPSGKEVEELTGKEIVKALKNRVPAREFLESLKQKPIKAEAPVEVEEAVKAPEAAQLVADVPPHVIEEIKGLEGTLEALLYDSKWRIVKRVPVRDLVKTIPEIEDVSYVIFDGVITQRLVDAAFSGNVKMLIGARRGDVKIPNALISTTFEELLRLSGATR